MTGLTATASATRARATDSNYYNRFLRVLLSLFLQLLFKPTRYPVTILFPAYVSRYIEGETVLHHTCLVYMASNHSR